MTERHTIHLYEKVGCQNFISDTMTVILAFFLMFSCFLDRAYACDMIVHTLADQLLTRLHMMDNFDTSPLQYRHIRYLHEKH